MIEQPRRRGRLFFFGVFIILAVLVLYLLSPYLGAIAIALVTVVMLKPLFDWFMGRNWVRGRSRLATTVTLISFFLLILIPLFIVGYLLITQAGELLDSLQSTDAERSIENTITNVEDFLHGFPSLSDIEIDQEQFTQNLLKLASSAIGWLADLAVNLGLTLPSLFIGAIIFLIIVATLLPTLDDVNERMQRLSPLDVNITQIYQEKSREMIMSVVKGVFLLVIIQGLIMGFFYWLAGVPFTIFWTLLSMAFGILPVVGISFIVWFLAIIFLLLDNTGSALIVLFGFYVVVNPLDLILRPRLVSKKAYLNFTLMLLALFGGLAVGGLLGMIYGPVIMILFMTTIDIYAKYYSDEPSEPDVNALESAGLAVPAHPLAEGDEEIS
jgi:predicted PurR-regulated permease PerM